MDLDYLELVLNDFTLKQLYIVNWLNNHLDKNIEGRHSKILNILREYHGTSLNDWTPLKIEQALMVVNELGFLNRNEEAVLNKNLKVHLKKVKASNISIEPYVKTCCDTQLKIKSGRDITVFGINNDRQDLVVLMSEKYGTLNLHFVQYWSLHKQHHSCGITCSKAFVSDGFQKPARWVCGNVRMTIRNPELGKPK
ncbi:unnamed protein product [Adineta steineri]|uniref:Uncharacterized protein n=1 Tax=Adineta steineri TaxID=433720 RepID=A0A819V379_9BILA|nr:unnamed protein product [Adineta steineri]CAF4093411.1 unnamed protein product [Adineta steineri]